MTYLLLLRRFLLFSASKALQFRFDFSFRIVMDCVFYIVNLGFFELLYRHTTTLAGWDWPQTRIFVAGFLFSDALSMTLFSNNLWWFPVYVNRGDLDYYLIRPVSALFILSLRDLAIDSFVNLLITLGILYWALSAYSESLSFLQISLFIVLLLNGVFITYAIRILLLMAVFWTHSSDGITTSYFSLSKLSERPHRLFPTPYRWLLLTIMPMALVSSVPSQILFEPAQTVPLVALTLVVSVALALMIRILWSRALRAYSSASS